MVVLVSLASGLFLLAALGCEHGAGAPRRAATAGEQFLQCRRVTLIIDEGVIVVQLLARLDRMQRMDVDAPVLFVGFAVRRAGMVDPARVVAAAPAVDHAAVVQAEVEGVVHRTARLRRALGRLIPADAFAAVFDDALAGIDVAPGEDAVAVDRRLLHFVGRIGPGCGLGGHVGFDSLTADRCMLRTLHDYHYSTILPCAPHLRACHGMCALPSALPSAVPPLPGW